MIGLISMKKVLKLNKSIYSRDFIENTVSIFCDLAHIDIIENEEYYDCVFSGCKLDTEKTVCEFENYLIAISNNGRL